MLKFDFTEGEVKALAVGNIARQMPFITAFALTNAMKDAREGEIASMQSVFDRPTRYTLGALKVTPATKRDLRAAVGFKEGFGGTPAWKYLGPQVHGGARRRKRFEIALTSAGILRSNELCVPGQAANLDGSGNISRGQLVRILSALGASTDATQNTKRRPKRGNRRRNLDYFVLRGTRAPDGIYLRDTDRKPKPVLIFVKSAAYTKRLPYYEKAQRIIPSAFRKHFRIGMDRYIRPELGRRR